MHTISLTVEIEEKNLFSSSWLHSLPDKEVSLTSVISSAAIFPNVRSWLSSRDDLV